MRSQRHSILPVVLFVLTAALPVQADYLNQTLEQAHRLFHSATNRTMYAAAARQYELLVEEEGIRNGHLLYTLGNSWFMAGDLGRAILNYRRAEGFLPGHADVKHNLAAAREARIDLIPERSPHPITAQLLGWHIHTQTSQRWWWFAGCWSLFWAALLWQSRTKSRRARIATGTAGLLAAALLASLSTESLIRSHAEPGVIIADEVISRKGNGIRYAPAFREPLHSGTEFETMERRGDWRQIRLADRRTCWIPVSAAEMVNPER